MTQKKVSTGINSTAAVLELDENDELVESVTTTKTLGRRKRKEEPPPVAESTDDDPPTDYIDVIDGDDEENEDPGYSETSIAARLFGYRKDGREDFSSHHCTAIIRREPDDIRDSFMVPCSRQTYIGKLPGISITTNEEDLADRIREMNGGGNYTVQYHYNGKIQSEALAITIADDRNKVAAGERGNLSAAAATQPAAVHASPSPVVDPLDSLLASVDKFAKLKEVFGGGDAEKVKMEMQIEQLRHEIEAAKNAPAERKSERLTLFEAALAAGSASPLQSKILDNLFPSEEKESRHWAAELLEVAIQNKEVIFEVAGPLLASFLGAGRGVNPPQMPPPGMPQQIPPPAFPPPPPMQSMFAPRTPEPPTPEPPDQFDTVVSVLVDSGHLQIPNYSTDDVPEGLVAVRGDVGEGEQSIVAEPTPPKKRGPRRLTKDEEPDNSNAIDAEEKTA